MLSLLAGLVALGCAAASAYRLELAVCPTSLDPALLTDALSEDGAGNWMRLRDAIVARALPWESALFAAFAEESDAAREGSLSEYLLELDWQSQRLSRVPRVCASIATSAGFLFASIALMGGLAAPEPATAGVLTSALNSLSLGIAGTSFCVAVHLRVRRVIRKRLASTHRLVDQLRALVAPSA
jgi:hypothetical protein